MPLGIDFTQILMHLFNVIILFFGLYVLLYSPVVKFMEKRQAYYEQLDQDTKQRVEDAKALQESYQAHLDTMEQESLDEKSRVAQEMDDYRQEKIKEANEEASKIIEKARKDAIEKKEHILKDVKDEISDLVFEATQKVMCEKATNDIYDTFLDEVEGSHLDGHQ